MSNGGNTASIFQQVAVVEQKSPFDIDKLTDRFRRRATDWSIPEAFLCILYSATAIDGSFDAKEMETIRMVVSRSRAMSALTPQALAQADKTVNERMRNRPNALQEACHTLPADMCLTVFAHCVDVVLADGQLVKSEATFLTELASMLELKSVDANRVMEVMLVKAQY
jgi:uncharacterized tellurite resistance protein B-like protein